MANRASCLCSDTTDRRRLSHGSALDGIRMAMQTTEVLIGPAILTHTDQHLLDLLKRNYDIVTALADIERIDSSISAITTASDTTLLSAAGDSPKRRNTGDNTTMQLRAQRKFGMCNEISPSTSMTDFGIEESDSRLEKMKAHFARFYLDLLDALSETNDDIKSSQPYEAPPLSAHTLRRDMKRCLIASQPYIETAAGMRDLFIWKAPIASLMMFAVYSYCVYRGWLFSMILFLVLLQLLVNYLSTQRNIDLGLDFVPRKDVPMPKLDLSGAQLVFDIARKVQVILGIAADVLEKVRSLFAWRRPDTTLRFLILVAFWFCMSLYFTMSTCFTLLGLVLGCKAFLTTYLFHRFPRLRHKLDIIVWFLDRLPTTAESPIASPRQRTRPRAKSINTIPSNNSDSTRSMISLSDPTDQSGIASIASSMAMFDKIKTCKNFSPKLCICRQGTIISARNGGWNPASYTKVFVFLNNIGDIFSGLLFRFRRTSGNEKEQMTINFDEIWSLEKIHTIKSFTLMPGTGRAIEVHLEQRRRPMHFIGIAKRDQFFDAVIDAARLAGVALRYKQD